MAKVIKEPKLKCDECRWDAIAMAIAMAAGKPEEFVSGCKVHKKVNTAIREADEADDYDPEEIDGYTDTCELCGAEVEETQRYCHECGVDRLAFALQNVPEGF